ncbi:MAG: HAD-IIIA family hydrolase [Muribaculaceae bacterium]|nr:HAD-IIIA family hydrolase [Muribaculaceae bacterium]
MFGYFPNDYVDSPYSIDYHKLWQAGFRLLLFDIDNTLVPHGADGTPESLALLKRVEKMGFKVILISNNNNDRILRFLQGEEIEYIAEADKPDPGAILKAMNVSGVGKEQAIMIGDTTHTDILAANRSGISSILVKYIGYDSTERKGIRRTIEKFMLHFFPIFRKPTLFR